MLSVSNQKLGRVHGWGLPAVASCPGHAYLAEVFTEERARVCRAGLTYIARTGEEA